MAERLTVARVARAHDLTGDPVPALRTRFGPAPSRDIPCPWTWRGDAEGGPGDTPAREFL